jgi:zinc transport system substrate-binding protein
MALDSELKETVSKDPTLPLVVSHPVYDYLTRRYQLNIESVHWEPDEILDNKQWIEMKGILENHPARWMIWEGAPFQESVKKLESIGMNSIIFAPCGNVPAEGDFMDVMRRNVQHFKEVFGADL